MSDRIEVVRGGELSDEGLVAIVIALTPVAGTEQEPAGPPAWRRAAIIEGLGGRPVTSARDLDGRGPFTLL